MTRIGQATAEQVRATGISWAFAPTLAVVQNPRWGRTYESYSSDPALVRRTAKRWCGPPGRARFADIGARDRETLYRRWRNLPRQGPGRDAHERSQSRPNPAAGYYGALKANVQTVMVSYSSFTDTSTGKRWGKMHGVGIWSTGVLKRRLDFDGLVVSDWNAIGQVPGCTNWHCPQAINAGST